jgi:hypothetical protein
LEKKNENFFLFFYFSICVGFLIFSFVGFFLSAGWLRNDAFSPVIGTSGSDDLSVSFTVSGCFIFLLIPGIRKPTLLPWPSCYQPVPH